VCVCVGGGVKLFFDSVTNLQLVTNTCKSDFKLVENSTSSFDSPVCNTSLCSVDPCRCCVIRSPHVLKCSLNVLPLADAAMC
jgi:hypothetical protein